MILKSEEEIWRSSFLFFFFIWNQNDENFKLLNKMEKKRVTLNLIVITKKRAELLIETLTNSHINDEYC
jgi:hypothetical protein